MFRVWAPGARRAEIHLVSPEDRLLTMEPRPAGYHEAVVQRTGPGASYWLRLDGGEDLPDPASRRQPRGIHGPSAVVDPAFRWRDESFRVPPLRDLVFYEIHVGTFTPEGTFDAVIPRLDRLVDLGVNALELMPVAPFPGERNWGYDGVFPYGVQESYGGPEGLRRLVDACHARGIAVALDVVYNHLGPEGNCLGRYGPYFTDRYRTPWGDALNFDGPGSDEVRRFFIGAAIRFLEEDHIDIFRVDAIHAIVDSSAVPFLLDLTSTLREASARLGRTAYVVAESDLNDSRVVRPAGQLGLGFDAQWSDDFHHSLHVLLTAERTGYYQDFGGLEDLARACREGFVYSGQHSRFRNRRHGNSARDLEKSRFVLCSQNHDQVGNRATGDRLAASLPARDQKLVACALMLAPGVPLLFMGQEYGETAPFPYFTSHSDPGLAEAVRRGRRSEFTAFGWREEEIPDPQDLATFRGARIDWDLSAREPHATLWRLHRDLIRLRRERPALGAVDPGSVETAVHERERVILIRRRHGGDEAVILLAFGKEPAPVKVPLAEGGWVRALDTEDDAWGGPGSRIPERIASDGECRLELAARSCTVLARCDEERS